MRFHLQRDAAGLRELDRVAQEVEQNLAKPGRIAHQIGVDARVDLAGECQALLVGPRGHHLAHFLQVIAQGKADLLQIQLGGLHLRKIEDVVDQVKKVVARTPENLHELVLLRRQRRLR